MSSRKLIICSAIALITVITDRVASAPYYENENYDNNKDVEWQDCSIGNRVPGDRLAARQVIPEQNGWLVVTGVGKKFKVAEWERISLIHVIDKATNDVVTCAPRVKRDPEYVDVSFRFMRENRKRTYLLDTYERAKD